MARQKKPINWDVVEKRMEAGNSAREIAKHLRIDINTFYDRFKEEYQCGFADFHDGITECGNADIIYTQHMKALSGNVTLLMYLGRVKCGQKEPENMQMIPPHEESLSLRHENMILKSQLEKLLNANKSETE